MDGARARSRFRALVRAMTVALGMVAAFGGGRVNAAEAPPLRFAPLPMEDPETVIRQARPMLAYLERRLARRVDIVYSADYGDLLAKFRSGAVDMAYLGPLPYMALRDHFPAAEPVVHFREASGGAAYTCAVVGWADTVGDLRGLAGRRVALTQPLSTCGYLSTRALLRAQGTDIEDTAYQYLGAHDRVALAVVRGEFDVGGMKAAIARKYAHLGLRVLAETAPLPSFALIVNRQTVAPAVERRLVDILTGLDPVGADQALMADWGEPLRHGAVPARDADYDGLRAMDGWTAIPEQGNWPGTEARP